MKKVVVFLVIFLFLLNTSLALLLGDISGIVYTPDYCYAGLADVQVDLGGGDVRHKTAACGGSYLHQALHSGSEYIVTFSKQGYLPKTITSVSVSGGHNTHVSASLSARTGESYPTCFYGTVTDAVTGEKLSGVAVSASYYAEEIILNSFTGGGSSVTGDFSLNPCYNLVNQPDTFKFKKGCYSLGPALNGSYDVTFTKSGYIPKTIEGFYLGDCTKTLSTSLDPLPPYVDCGIRVYDGTSNVIPACEPTGTVTSPLRVFNGSDTYGVVLVDPSDSAASNVRIQTSSGVKALRKL